MQYLGSGLFVKDFLTISDILRVWDSSTRAARAIKRKEKIAYLVNIMQTLCVGKIKKRHIKLLPRAVELVGMNNDGENNELTDPIDALESHGRWLAARLNKLPKEIFDNVRLNDLQPITDEVRLKELEDSQRRVIESHPSDDYVRNLQNEVRRIKSKRNNNKAITENSTGKILDFDTKLMGGLVNA